MPRVPKVRTMKGPAQLWKRGLAFLFDLLIIDFIIASPFSPALSKIIPSDSIAIETAYLESNPSMMNAVFLLLIVMSILVLLYFALFEFIFGATPGKMITKIEVVSESKKLTIWQCLVRNLFVMPIFPFIILWITEPLFLLIKQRRLLEILSKTKTEQVYTI